jgi:hypothetical protein
VSNWHHILVWEVSTIAIPGQRLLERCEWSLGDVQATGHPTFKSISEAAHEILDEELNVPQK